MLRVLTNDNFAEYNVINLIPYCTKLKRRRKFNNKEIKLNLILYNFTSLVFCTIAHLEKYLYWVFVLV